MKKGDIVFHQCRELDCPLNEKAVRIVGIRGQEAMIEPVNKLTGRCRWRRNNRVCDLSTLR